jgi:DNA mismatch repair protein MutS2
VIFPENFENKIDFTRIRELIRGNCISSIGKSLVDTMRFTSKYDSVKLRLVEIAEFVTILNSNEEFPVEYYFDLRASFAKMRIDGTYLETKELYDLRRTIKTVKAVVRFFQKEEAEQKYGNLKNITKRVTVHPYVIDGIDRILNSHGKIRDNASPELADIRRELAVKQSSVSKLISTIIAKAKKDGWVDAEMTPAIRDGRTVIPVPASFKRKIPGIIHDESATGKTCYVEPAPVVEVNNAISELEAKELREIVKILKEFTETIRPYADDLEDCIGMLGIMDFIRAKALFAQQIDAVLPDLTNTTEFNWKNARHPLLFLSFQKENRKVVPLNIGLTEKNRILLISGPNAGGKSVCLKTVGLLQYMLQCGILIPVDKNSNASVFKNIFIDIGDEQSIENDLSTYSSHLLNMKHFTKNADKKTLILIDEFGTGTEPMLGGAIAEAVLNRINQAGTYGVITTHYTNLKHFASSQRGIINGAMLYDTQKLEPLFILETGKPGSSFAFEIAYKIGLPQDIIDEAKSKVGEEHVNFDKHLREILRDKRYWERKRDNIRRIERRLEELLEKEKAEFEKAYAVRKEIKQKAEEETKKILSDTNKIIENTVRRIKESQAEKEKTKKVRQKLNKFKEDVFKQNSEDEEKILRKIEKIKERKNRIKQKKEQYSGNVEPDEKKTVKPREQEFTIGMPVKIKGQTTIGEIMELTKKNAVVAFSNLLITVAVNKLEHLTNQEKKSLLKKKSGNNFKQSYELNKRRLQFKPGLDVRGKRADEALQAVTDFIDEAIMVGAGEVKILHGTGNGILRHLIREYLATVDVVKSFKDEHIEFGGAGITVVELELE